MSSFGLNIRFVYFRAKGARARVYFPAPYFLYSVARIARTAFLFFVSIMKEKIVLRKARYKIGDSTRKPSPERVMKSECFKIRGPCDGKQKKKPRLSQPSNAQLVSNL